MFVGKICFFYVHILYFTWQKLKDTGKKVLLWDESVSNVLELVCWRFSSCIDVNVMNCPPWWCQPELTVRRLTVTDWWHGCEKPSRVILWLCGRSNQCGLLRMRSRSRRFGLEHIVPHWLNPAHSEITCLDLFFYLSWSDKISTCLYWVDSMLIKWFSCWIHLSFKKIT